MPMSCPLSPNRARVSQERACPDSEGLPLLNGLPPEGQVHLDNANRRDHPTFEERHRALDTDPSPPFWNPCLSPSRRVALPQSARQFAFCRTAFDQSTCPPRTVSSCRTE